MGEPKTSSAHYKINNMVSLLDQKVMRRHVHAHTACTLSGTSPKPQPQGLMGRHADLNSILMRRRIRKSQLRGTALSSYERHGSVHSPTWTAPTE